MTAPLRSDTWHPFSKRNARARHKALFRVGCAMLGVEYPTVAAVCDEDIATVKAWAHPHRDHAIPQWAWRRIARELPALAAYVDEGMAAFYAAVAPARDADAEAMSTIAQLSAAVAALAGAVPDGISPSEASHDLAALCAAHAQLGAQIAAHARRAGVPALETQS